MPMVGAENVSDELTLVLCRGGVCLDDEICMPPTFLFSPSFSRCLSYLPFSHFLFTAPGKGNMGVNILEGRAQSSVFTKNRFVFIPYPFLSRELCYPGNSIFLLPHITVIKLWLDGCEHLCVSTVSLDVGGEKQNQELWARAGLAPIAFLRCYFPLNHSTCSRGAQPWLWLLLHSQA